MSTRRLLRAGLILLAVGYGLGGLVQLFLPKVFYDHGPWLARLPPYNEHLMTDIGALTLATVMVLVVAAFSMQALLVRTALGASLMFGVPHFVFHAMHLAHFPASEAVTQTAVLSAGVVFPVAPLVLSTRQNATE